MMKRLLIATMTLWALTVASISLAQSSTPATVLNYGMAEQAMAAAVAEARANNWNLTLVIADHAGVPVMMHRMDGASPFTHDIALRKIRVVTATGLSSGEYGQRLQAGDIEEVENGVTFAGGVPVMYNGEMIGSIATSGARGSEDEQVSLAGAAAISN